jgi:hypothetical protein
VIKDADKHGKYRKKTKKKTKKNQASFRGTGAAERKTKGPKQKKKQRSEPKQSL